MFWGADLIYQYSLGYIIKEANLSLSVIEPPTTAEQVKDFWSAYGSLITLMGAGFAGGLSTYLFDYLKNRKKSGAPIEKNSVFLLIGALIF